MAAGDLVNGAVFRVSFFGLELGFSKVGGLSGSVEYDAYLEGGGRMHLLYRPSTSAGTITLEKGVSAVDQQVLQLLQPGIQIPGLTIDLQKNGKTVESYYIESGMLISWQLGDLDALSSSVVIKTFTIAHTGILVSGRMK
ncbi:phage tail protein [Angelakisella massiliensis]|uniref:phage tail protein n=1 Tax=Angelakisella massiliensis TaxID=1871018 RepID=UPI0008F80500|nr:phage tail protein [Angelakisella massiliensis]